MIMTLSNSAQLIMKISDASEQFYYGTCNITHGRAIDDDNHK